MRRIISQSVARRAGCAWCCLWLLLGFTTRMSAFNLPPVWRWSNPQPNGANIYGLIYNSETYVEVGECGQIFDSSDGQTWYPLDTGVTNDLCGVTYLGGRLVVTGENGKILISDDLAAVYDVSQSTTNWLLGVAASSNLVVAVGDNAVIYTSSNAVVWTQRSVSFTDWLSSIAYGTNTFVVVGEDGFIATSPNGTAWTTRTSGTTAYFNCVAWLGDRFLAVAGGGVAVTSPNGTTWTTVGSGVTNDLYVAAGTNSSRIIAGNQALLLQGTSSYSSQIASTLTSPAPGWPYYSAAWNGSNYLAAGLTGLLVESYTTNSTTGWNTSTNSYRSWLWQVAHLQNNAESNYVAVGNYGTILASANGINWEVELPPTNSVTTATNTVLLGVGGGTNLFLIAGTKGTVWWATNTYLWNAVSPSPTTNDLQGVWFDGYRYLLCGGNGTILAGINGTNWTARTTPVKKFLMSFAQTSNSLVSVGENGTILTSPNSTNWTQQTSGTTNWLSQVSYLNHELIAVGEAGTILTSTNATNWTAVASGTTNWLNAVTGVGGAWFIAGDQGTLLISTNGANWTNSGTITKQSLFGLAVNAGQLVTVGVNGVILRSQVLPATTPVAFAEYSRQSGENVFYFTGQPDQRFSLQSTNRLSATKTNATWVNGPLLEFFESSGTLLYLDTAQTNAAPTQFYRTETAD